MNKEERLLDTFLSEKVSPFMKYVKLTLEDLKEDKSVVLDLFTSEVNRSKGQTLFLFKLLNEDFYKLLLLEKKIREKNVAYCPSTLEEVEELLK